MRKQEILRTTDLTYVELSQGMGSMQKILEKISSSRVKVRFKNKNK